MDLWISKYSPKKSSEIIANTNNIKTIREWLSKFPKVNDGTLIISGNHGIGKTLSVKLLLEELSYKPIYLYPCDIKNHKFMDELVNKKDDYGNIQNYMMGKNYKSAIVIDEIETITLASEKGYLTDLYKQNNKLRIQPLIFICNTQHSKLINDIKKNSLEINFLNPTFEEILPFIKSIFKKENFKVSNNLFKPIVEHSQYDIRKLLILMEELKNSFGNKMTQDNFNTFVTNSLMKDLDVGLFKSTQSLFEKEMSVNEILKLYEPQKVLLPLMGHQNYYNQICSRKEGTTINDMVKNMKKISKSISIGDIVETSIYTEQNWCLQVIHGFLTCVVTNYYVDKSITPDPELEIEFSADLNKTSLKNINKKNISTINTIIPNKSIYEVLYISYISSFLLKKLRYNDLIKILKDYKDDLTIKDIELLIKIDKTAKKYVLPTKYKKVLNYVLNNI